MAKADLILKRGDTREVLRAVLEATGAESGVVEPIDLAEAETIRLFMVAKIGNETRKVHTGPVEVVDAAAGKIEYRWEAEDLDDAGTYRIEFEITWADGGIQTVPNDGFYTIEVVEDLGPSEGEE